MVVLTHAMCCGGGGGGGQDKTHRPGDRGLSWEIPLFLPQAPHFAPRPAAPHVEGWPAFGRSTCACQRPSSVPPPLAVFPLPTKGRGMDTIEKGLARYVPHRLEWRRAGGWGRHDALGGRGSSAENSRFFLVFLPRHAPRKKNRGQGCYKLRMALSSPSPAPSLNVDAADWVPRPLAPVQPYLGVPARQLGCVQYTVTSCPSLGGGTGRHDQVHSRSSLAGITPVLRRTLAPPPSAPVAWSAR